MSSENVEAVRRFVDAFNRLDLDSVIGMASDDVQLDEWPEAPGAQSYHGPAGVRAALDQWFESWEWMQVEITDIRDLGDRVLFGLHQRAKGRGSAVEVEIDSFNVYTFGDDGLARIQLFTDEQSALEAAGLAGEETAAAAGDEAAPADNGEVVRRLMEGFDRRDFAAMLAVLDPAVELVEWPNSPDAKTFRGHDGALRAFESWFEAWEWLRTELEQTIEAGDKVLVCGHTTGKGKGSAVEVGVGAFNVYTLRDRKVTRIEFFTEREPAVRAAGFDAETLRDIERQHEIYAGLARGDVQGVSKFLHPDAVWEHNIGVGSPEEGVYRGRESLIALYERILEPWEELRPRMRRFRVLGPGRYEVDGVLEAKHATSRVEIVTPFTQMLELRDGLLTKGTMTMRTAEAFPAANGTRT
jgi:ketosteroid isomerase-like protein